MSLGLARLWHWGQEPWGQWPALFTYCGAVGQTPPGHAAPFCSLLLPSLDRAQLLGSFLPEQHWARVRRPGSGGHSLSVSMLAWPGPTQAARARATASPGLPTQPCRAPVSLSHPLPVLICSFHKATFAVCITPGNSRQLASCGSEVRPSRCLPEWVRWTGGLPPALCA